MNYIKITRYKKIMALLKKHTQEKTQQNELTICTFEFSCLNLESSNVTMTSQSKFEALSEKYRFLFMQKGEKKSKSTKALLFDKLVKLLFSWLCSNPLRCCYLFNISGFSFMNVNFVFLRFMKPLQRTISK